MKTLDGTVHEVETTELTGDPGGTAWTDISGNSFNNTELTEISGDSGCACKSFGRYCFSYCCSLTSVTIPDSVTSIEYFSFLECDSLTFIAIPDSVTVIEDSVFNSCDQLKDVIISDSVTSIGRACFSWNVSLSSVIIGAGVSSIGEDCFIYCSDSLSIDLSRNKNFLSANESEYRSSWSVPSVATIIFGA